MIEQFKGKNVTLGPYAEVGPFAKAGEGSVIHGCLEGEIGKNTKVWRWVHVMKGAKIGDNCMLGQCSFVADGAVLGNNVRIQNHTNVSRHVTIEDDVYVGAGVQFCNAAHPSSKGGDQLDPITIKRGASIGSNVCIVGKVTIGENAVVGAGAVVTHDVPANTKAMGIPARQK